MAKKPEEKDGQDLTTILNTSQRADLTLLIANATESMRQVLIDNFDATAGLNKSLLGVGLSEDEKLMRADPANTDVEALDRERKLREVYEKDLATLKMKNLRKNSLKAYDEWRESVIMRVGQVVNSETTAREQLDKEAKAAGAKPRAPSTTGKVSGTPKKSPNTRFRDLFTPTKTPLTKLPMDKRQLILHSILLLLLSLEHYNAPSRILLLNLTSSLKLPLKTFEQDEYTTAKGLLEAAKEMTADAETKKKAEENKDSRKWKVGLATVAGAAVIGVTGGLAAPLVAAGVGSVMGGLGLGATAAAGYLGSVAGSTLLVGSLFGAYGGRMTGQMMDNYAREVEDFAFLPVHSDKKTSEDEKQGAEQASDHDHKLRVTICISGWLTEKEEVVKPWRVLGTTAEVFALKYELEALLNLGNAMNGVLQSAAWGYAQKELIAQTIFADLAAAMWPIGLMKVSRVIDNPFSVAKGRAEKAGEVLADALINKAQGERPVTLIGYSLGARVIYACLKSLAKRKAFGLIENVVLIGSPTPSDTTDWRILRSVVSGRLVNVFSTNDYILGFMYRTSSIQFGVAGLQRIEGLAGVENVDVSEDVNGHLKYRYLVGAILKKIGFEDINMEAVEEERVELEKVEKEEEKNSLQAQRKRLLRRQSTGGKADEAAEAEVEASDMEKQIAAQTQQSLVTKAIQYFYMPNVPSTKDAEKVVGNVQDAAKDPTKAGTAVDQTAEDVQASTESYAQWAARKLPSMPGTGGGKPSAKSVQDAAADPTKAAGDAGKIATDPSKAAGDISKTATDAAATAQTYAQRATGYLPSLPSSLPSLPSLPGRGKAASKQSSTPADSVKEAVSTPTNTAKEAANSAKQAASAPTDTAKQAADGAKEAVSAPTETANKAAEGVKQAASAPTDTAKQVADSGQSAAKATAGVLADTVKPTINNLTEPEKNPAVGAAKDTAKNTPVINEATEKLPAMPGTNAKKQESKSYLSTAGSYIPSFGFGGSASTPKQSEKEAKPSAPKRAPSEVKKQPPKLDRVPSGLQSPPAKLDRVPSGIKSPAPKLDRVPSGLKSPSPKLDRVPSGIKSPAPKLDRVSSGVKSPLSKVPSGVKSKPPKLDQVSSKLKESPAAAAEKLGDAPKQATKAGGDAASKVQSGGQQAVKTGGDVAKKVQSSSQGAVKTGGDAAGKAGQTGKAAVDTVQSGGKQAVKTGADTAGKVQSGGQQALKSGGGAAGTLGQGGKDAAGKVQSGGQQAVKTGGDAAGKVSTGGQKALKSGGNAASNAAGKLTGALPGFGK